MISSPPRAEAGLQTQLESQEREDNEILESPEESLGECIYWLIRFIDRDMEAGERMTWLGTHRK